MSRSRRRDADADLAGLALDPRLPPRSVAAGAEQSGRDGVVVSFDGRSRPGACRATARRRSRSRSRAASAAGRRPAAPAAPDRARLRRPRRPRHRGPARPARARACATPPSARRSPAAGRRWSAAARSSPKSRSTPNSRSLARAGVLAFNGRAGGPPGGLGPCLLGLAAGLLRPPLLPAPLRRRRLRAAAARRPWPRALGRWPRLRSFQITLGRRYSRSRPPPQLPAAPAARCRPASAAFFPLARATYHFCPAPDPATTTILRGCRVRD